LATVRYLARGWKRFGLDVLRRLYLDAEMVAAHPEVVHFEFGALAAGRMYLAELLGSRVVVSFRGYDLNHAGLDSPGYYDEVWEKAAAIHCLSRDLWEKAKRRGCPAAKPHVLILPAIETGYFAPARRARGKRPVRLLSVGRLEWAKGYEYALETVAVLRARGVSVEYRIVGAGEHLEAVAFCRHQLELEDTVTLVGAAERERVRAELEWADIFLHTAVTEGFSNAVIEAQASGLPVVTSDAGGLPENVEDGVTGFVVPRRDPRAAADCVERLARDPALRERLGQAGRERVQQRFSLEAQIRAFQELYRRVIESGTADERAGEPYLARRV
jgi:colanic acid/amylovoran biosynthesis glycosyltransferase